MLDVEAEVTRSVAERIRALRAERGLSLEALARQSGVSRSMISVIERGESSPTAAVLAKLGNALGVTMATLFEVPAARQLPSPLARRAEQPVWEDPASGYRRRNVTPASVGHSVHLVEVLFPPRARVSFDNGGPAARIEQQVWVLEGIIEISLGAERYRLHEGDCLAMQLDRMTTFYNPTRKLSRYAVVSGPRAAT